MALEEWLGVQIFTDGSCNVRGALRPGGFGVYCLAGDKEIYLKKGFWNTTTSRMEMMALLAAVKMIDPAVRTKLHVVSDSQFIVNSFKNGLISKWRMCGWVGVKNAELWKEIVQEIDGRRKMLFNISWINGHGRDLSDPLVFGNACADALANYKTQDRFDQDKPLEGFSWFYHKGTNTVFIEKTEQYKELNKAGEVLPLGDCYYAVETELTDKLKETLLFDAYRSGNLDVKLQIETI